MRGLNTAAEAITTAADPEANIIFGATINPDLDGEIIITVVATGFDASYFTNRRLSTDTTNRSTKTSTDENDGKTTALKSEDKVMGNLDMNLDDTDSESDFHSDDNGLNMWTMDNVKEEMTLIAISQRKKTTSIRDLNTSHDVISGVIEDEDEVEKQPSFLRRLKNRRKNDQDNNSVG